MAFDPINFELDLFLFNLIYSLSVTVFDKENQSCYCVTKIENNEYYSIIQLIPLDHYFKGALRNKACSISKLNIRSIYKPTNNRQDVAIDSRK